MSREPALARAPQRHRTHIQVRMADTDAYGHVNNASYASYAEAGRLDFWQFIGGNVGSFILAHLSIDFRKQVKFGEPAYVDTWVEKIGRSSMTLGQQVVARDVVAADVGSVIVHFDYATNTAIQVPERLRARLHEFAR